MMILLFLGGLALVISGGYFFLKIMKWAFGSLIESLGVIIFDAYRYFTYILPNKKSGRFEQQAREKAEKQALIKASQEKLIQVRSEKEIEMIVKAAVNRALYLQNKNPYADDYLIDKYIINFSTSTIIQLESIEKEIQKSHAKNMLLSNTENVKTYTLEDISNKQPTDRKFEYPFEMRLFMFGPDYVLHIRDTLEKSDVLIQSREMPKILNYMMDVERRFEHLRNRSNIKSRI